MTVANKKSEIFLVYPALARNSKRNFKVYIHLATKILRQKNFNYTIIKPDQIGKIVETCNANKIFLEMGYFYLVKEFIDSDRSWRKKESQQKTELIAINSGVDLFIGTAAYVKNLHSPRKILAIYRWKRGLNRILRNDSWLIPSVSEQEIIILGKKTLQVSQKAINTVLNSLFKDEEIAAVFNKIKNRNSPLIILALGMPISDEHIANLASAYKHLTNNHKFDFLVKPHPNITLSAKQLKLIEQKVGTQSCNYLDKNSIEIIRSLPLESILNYFPKSIYVGFFTGGINYVDPSRVYWINSGDRRIDKMNEIYYGEYRKLWTTNYLKEK